jgi:hypothetical protein
MNREVEWDEIEIDDMQPTAIGEILPEVLANYGLGGPSVGRENPVLCGETAASTLAMADVS